MILQEAEIGIIAVGVTQVIIMGGIDLSSGSVVGMTAMIAASLAQTGGLQPCRLPQPHRPQPRLPRGCRPCLRVARRPRQRLADRLHEDPAIHRNPRHDGLRARCRGLVHERRADRQSRGFLCRDRLRLVAGHHLPRRWRSIFHFALRYTRYGKFTYAIGANPLAARVSGINVERHIILVYIVAGLLSGLCGVVHTARAISGQAGVGVGFELDAIAAAVIGGTSLSGGVGRLTGTIIGAVILGILTSGFTFLNVDAHYQEIIKGGVIVAAVIADQYRQRKRRAA